ncbi:hypothetical protein ACIA5G_14865 [Amycolatopsis sp. NPDC051758]|uniref:hypothetical protein n=1 Tax=Amycolatopsis sp. NPDC051758 TaxID=3363935 RepID=UPI0037B9C3C2
MGLLFVFLSLVVLFTAVIIILVGQGSPVGLAITVPAAVISAASGAVLFLRNLFQSPPAIAPPPRELPNTGDEAGQQPKPSETGS